MTKEKKVKPGQFILKIFILMVIVTGIVLAVLFAFQGDSMASFKWGQLDPMKLVKGLQEEHGGVTDSAFSIDDLNVIMTGVYNNQLILLTDSDIRLVNAKGEELWYYTHELKQPVLSVNGQLLLVYEKTGKSYMVIRGGKVLLKDNLEEEIAFGEINDQTILFISKNNSGYKRAVYAISPENGIQYGALFIDDYYPYYAKTITTEKNRHFILYGLGMNSNRVSTIVRIYNSSFATSPTASIELEGLFPVLYENKDTRMFAGTSGAYYCNPSLDFLWSKEFETDLLAAGLFENKGTVFALEDTLLFYDQEGEEIKSIPLKYEVNSIVTHQNTAAVITGSEATFYNASGNVLNSVSLAGLTMRVHFVDEKKAFLISEHEAVLYAISSRNWFK